MTKHTEVAITPEIMQAIPLFADLHEVELIQVMACFSMLTVEVGEILYAEGTRATSACFVVDGELEAVTALPGGGEALVGLIAPGDMIGEMALIAGGSRTATVRARTNVTGISVSYAFFQAALNQMSVPAFKILRRIMHRLSLRLADLERRIFNAWDCGDYIPTRANASSQSAWPDEARAASFDYRRFLAVTPFFKTFEEDQIEAVLADVRILEISRNDYLYREESEADACFVVVRGAVDHSIMRDRRYQLSVMGPGRLCGANTMIEGKPHRCDARVRTDTLLLEFTDKRFRQLFDGATIEALKFQSMISHNQLLELKSADNLLTTLISQAHIRETAGKG